ncbi:MAG: NTP transferase domain-containing protein [Nitrososphaerota archaeon]
MHGLASVVLAGGRSERFGSNKLLVRIGGETMLAIVCRALSSISDEVYLSARSLAQGIGLMEVAGLDRVRVVADDRSLGCTGPAAGIVTAALKTGGDFLLVAPGDMPYLSVKPLEKFARLCISVGADAGSVFYGLGDVETLLQFHRTSWIVSKGVNICRMKTASVRATDLLRYAPKLVLIGAGRLTRNPHVFNNINTPSDLRTRRPSSDLSPRHLLMTELGRRAYVALELCRRGEYDSAARIFSTEGDSYLSMHVKLLAAHAYHDAWNSWVASINRPTTRR